MGNEYDNQALSEEEILKLKDEAFSKKQFIAFYQPQFDQTTGVIVGAEALSRWYHPEHGVIMPSLFIPVFEKYDVIYKLDLFIFNSACMMIRKFSDNDITPPPMHLNITRHDLYHASFIDDIEKIRKKNKVPAQYLRMEITESAITGGTDYINKVIERLHSAGYTVVLDDFGKGLSSFRPLRDVDVDMVKLDVGLINGAGNIEKGRFLFSSIYDIICKLELPCIAQGVETQEQADILREMGINNIQGFLFSKPLTPSDYEKLVFDKASL